MAQVSASTMIEASGDTLSVMQYDTFIAGSSFEALHHAELGNPLEVAEDAQKCRELIAKFDEGTPEQCCVFGERLAHWLTPVVRRFALSREGCRVVQKVLEKAGACSRDRLAKQLQPHILELVGSPHGNHVIAKMVEIMPPCAVCFVIEAIQRNPVEIARHRFGCRILERLVEHCSEKQMSAVFDAVVIQAEPLCRHPYGNFVISHLLEHGSFIRRAEILDQLLPYLPQLAVHRTASHVIQKAIDLCDEVGKRRLVERLLNAQSPHSIVEIACSRYGSFVVEDLVNVNIGKEEVRQYLQNGADTLNKSQFGKKVIQCFGLAAHTQQ